jgi:hypothetical protein
LNNKKSLAKKHVWRQKLEFSASNQNSIWRQKHLYSENTQKCKINFMYIESLLSRENWIQTSTNITRETLWFDYIATNLTTIENTYNMILQQPNTEKKSNWPISNSSAVKLFANLTDEDWNKCSFLSNNNSDKIISEENLNSFSTNLLMKSCHWNIITW